MTYIAKYTQEKTYFSFRSLSVIFKATWHSIKLFQVSVLRTSSVGAIVTYLLVNWNLLLANLFAERLS